MTFSVTPGVPARPLPGPDAAHRTVGVIGAGRVGAVLAAALRAAGHPVIAAGESDASRARIAALLPGVEVAKPTEVARRADLLLLTVPDDMLGNVVAMLVGAGAIHEGQLVVHTSGRHGLAVLDEAVGRGAIGLAMHPAMTFTGTAIDLPRLQGCVFGSTAPAAHRDLLESLVENLGGRVLMVAEEQRTLYHAALAHGANHLVTLVAQAAEMLRAAGSTDPAGTLGPLLRAALDNALDAGDAALTGPIVRGDVATVRDHLDELSRTAPASIDSYVSLGLDTLARATADGRVPALRAVEIGRVLTEARDRAAAHPVDTTEAAR